MTSAVSLNDEEAVKKVLVDSVLGRWDVVNNLTRIKPSRRDRYRVMWPGLIDWVRDAMLSFETPLINPEDVDIPVCVANADEAIAIIKDHRKAQAAQA